VTRVPLDTPVLGSSRKGSKDGAESLLSYESGPGSLRQGTVRGSAITLILTSIGSGIFALPYAFSLAGAGCGTVLAGVIGALSLSSAYALARCCQSTGCFTYEDVAVAAWGPRGAVLMELLILVLLLGAMAAIITVIGDALPAFGALLLPELLDWEAQRKRVLVVLLIFVLMPLSCVKTMTSLRHSNTIGVTCNFVVAAFVTINGAVQVTNGGGLLAHRPAFTDVLGGAQAVPILMLSYCMHVQVPPVFGELKERTVKKFSWALVLQWLTCTAVYVMVGIFGLRLFHPEEPVPGDVLLGFGPHGWMVLLMRSMVGLSATFVFPLLSLPCRSTVDHLLFRQPAGPAASKSSSSLWFSDWRQKLQAIGVVLVAGLGACSASSLAKITAITGATGGALLCYVMPCSFFLQLCRDDATASERLIFRTAWSSSVLLTIVALTSVVQQILRAE